MHFDFAQCFTQSFDYAQEERQIRNAIKAVTLIEHGNNRKRNQTDDVC